MTHRKDLEENCLVNFRNHKEAEVYSTAMVFNQLKLQNHFPNETLSGCRRRYKIGHWELLRTVWIPLL